MKRTVKLKKSASILCTFQWMSPTNSPSPRLNWPHPNTPRSKNTFINCSKSQTLKIEYSACWCHRQLYIIQSPPAPWSTLRIKSSKQNKRLTRTWKKQVASWVCRSTLLRSRMRTVKTQVAPLARSSGLRSNTSVPRPPIKQASKSDWCLLWVSSRGSLLMPKVTLSRITRASSAMYPRLIWSGHVRSRTSFWSRGN